MTYQSDEKLPVRAKPLTERRRKELLVARLEAIQTDTVALRPKKRRTQRARRATGRVNTRATIVGHPVTPFVYFIRATTLGLIKIGSTVDLDDRLKTLQVGSPDRLEIIGAISSNDAFRLEELLHSRFEDLREHGEWFRPGEELLAYVARWPLEEMYDGEAEKLFAVMR